jgi:hypothetical protein
MNAISLGVIGTTTYSESYYDSYSYWYVNAD